MRRDRRTLWIRFGSECIAPLRIPQAQLAYSRHGTALALIGRGQTPHTGAMTHAAKRRAESFY